MKPRLVVSMLLIGSYCVEVFDVGNVQTTATWGRGG